MTWFQFIIWLAAIYILYYGGLIIWELLQAKRRPFGDDPHELTFVEEFVPLPAESQDHGPAASADVSSVVSSGGVKLKDIFRLAQEEAIEYIRPVSF
ncbi:hypothetical protein [Mucilaginibacter lacusdianchii]|uniref:hypothetical protein n=1 Tax=Mucilaginibacter lacusdianchii TaxID=2684211 RepID=UPI00131DE459|nr:hypothetical protein [Mucilaginibacter sp. JXJ CY 39]